MTADERLESLLNRAGQTISDLPGDYETAKLRGIADVIHDWRPYDPNDGPKAILDAYRKYILHLTDIIDRMETALENVCGERDFLLKVIQRHRDGTPVQDCEICTFYYDYSGVCGEDCDDESPETDYFEFGVPEDISVKDAAKWAALSEALDG